MDNTAINVTGISKSFKLPHQKHTSVKSLFVNVFRGRRTYENQEVLRGISFEVKQGEFFGIVGRNGSGKSTLMKLLAGIYHPDQGNIEVHGKLVPFIELGVGFNPELTGRENVFLNGALLGFNRKEMQEMYDEIVEFAELEKSMDQKLKNYSSGMQVRLAFSIAIRAKGDILLLDEVLAVGDEEFQRKCFSYFKTLKKNKKTVIFISHDMGAVRYFCDRAILLDGGKLKSEGKASDIADKYSEMFITETTDDKLKKTKIKRLGTGKARIINATSNVRRNQIVINAEVVPEIKIDTLQYGIHIVGQDGNEIAAMNNQMLRLPDVMNVETGKVIFFEWKIDNIFSDGKYFITLTLADGKEVLDRYEEATSFRIKRTERSTTTILPPLSVEFRVHDPR